MKKVTLIKQFFDNQIFQRYISEQSINKDLTQLIIDLGITILLAVFLQFIYIQYSHSISDKKRFSRIFLTLSLTTFMIISIIQSSLTLSLGLVGALSIIRFRAAIKEPEELVYLFLSISIGLGLAANQRITTIIIYAFIVLSIIIADLIRGKMTTSLNSLILQVSLKNDQAIDTIYDLLQKQSDFLALKRLNQEQENLSATFIIKIDQLNKLESIRKKIKNIKEVESINIIDNSEIYI